MRLFVGNFDFETRLAAGGTGRENLPARLARLNAEMAPVWLAVAEDGDAIWCPEPIPEPFWSALADAGLPRVRAISRFADIPRDARLTPWGWNRQIADWGASAGLALDSPPLEIVRAANSRRYSWEWETRLGTALPGAAMCGTLAEVEAGVRSLAAARWVLKSEFSHAARERILGTGGTLAPEAAAWAGKRLARDGAVFLEPWVERVAEVGVQWTIAAGTSGESVPPALEGVTGLLTHPDGRYLGSQFAGLAEAPWIGEAIAATRRVAQDLGERGYAGPVGIDAMLYRGARGLAVRPVQDINARWTMGRLSLGWRRLMTAGEGAGGIWFHGEPPELPGETRHRSWRVAPDLVGTTPPAYCTTVRIGDGNL